MIKKVFPGVLIISCLVALISCSKTPKLEVELNEKFDGKNIELIDYIDSTILLNSTVTGGKASLVSERVPLTLTRIVVDGVPCGLYITEGGDAILRDSTFTAVGTPLNDRLTSIIQQMDSIEDLNDMNLYLNFTENEFNNNKDNVIGEYLGLLLLMDSPAEKFDSLYAVMPEKVKNSSKAKKYEESARLRMKTAPGKQFIDFEGEDENGKPLKLSQFFNGDNYVLVDFWASWCPYCIKELPQLAELYSKYKDKGLTIVGVAVRDLPEDTKAAVAKHTINWPVLFNTQRKPYDIYGMSGIPHHILIDPQGKIISRGENSEELDKRIDSILNK